MLSSSLFTAAGNTADGNRVVFDPLYSNSVDAYDAIKLMNPAENFGLSRDNRVLAIEARQPVSTTDTIFYYLSHLQTQQYRLEITPQNMQDINYTCELVDRFTGLRTAINLSDSNHIHFEVTADASSRSSDRLFLVFSRPAPPPFYFTGVRAQNNEQRSVSVYWQVNHEIDIASYVIERSDDNIHFSSIETITPLYNDIAGGDYTFEDLTPLESNNSYRIKAIAKNGNAVYSDTVKVAIVRSKKSISIYPNPVTNKTFQLQTNGLPQGTYSLLIVSNAGQVIHLNALQINGIYSLQTVRLANTVSKGIYNLVLMNGNGIIMTEKLFVE